MMKAFSYLLPMIFALAVLNACESPVNSDLFRHAKPDVSNVKVLRVRDGDLIRFVMVSNSRGYELVCENPLGLLKLIDATGFPSTLVNSYPALDIDSDLVNTLKFREQPQLNCNAGTLDQVLYKAEIDSTTKYFFGPNKQATKLFMFGCQALVDAMGFDLKKADVLPAILIDQNPIFDVGDDKDLNCLKGFTIGSKVKWDAGSDSSLYVRPGLNLPSQTYTARNPDGSAAVLSWKTEGRCEWLEMINLPGSLVISGQVPENYRGQQCKAIITASAGTLMEDSRSLLIQTCASGTIFDRNGRCLAPVSTWVVDASLETKENLLYGVGPVFVNDKVGFTGGQIESDGVVYRTIDAGKTWTRQYFAKDQSVDSIAFVNANVGWVSGGGGLILKTIDGGASWTRQTTGTSGFFSAVIAIDELHAIIQGNDGTHFRTADGGKTWSSFKFTVPRENVMNFSFVDSSKGFAYTNSGLSYSLSTTDDGAMSWLPLKTLPMGYSYRQLYAFDFDILWLAADKGRLLKSTDGGSTWALIQTPATGGLTQVFFIDEKVGFVNSDNGLLLTQDGGRSWKLFSVSNTETFASGMSVVDAAHVFLLGEAAHIALPLVP